MNSAAKVLKNILAADYLANYLPMKNNFLQIQLATYA